MAKKTFVEKLDKAARKVNKAIKALEKVGFDTRPLKLTSASLMYRANREDEKNS